MIGILKEGMSKVSETRVQKLMGMRKKAVEKMQKIKQIAYDKKVNYCSQGRSRKAIPCGLEIPKRENKLKSREKTNLEKEEKKTKKNLKIELDEIKEAIRRKKRERGWKFQPDLKF